MSKLEQAIKEAVSQMGGAQTQKGKEVLQTMLDFAKKTLTPKQYKEYEEKAAKAVNTADYETIKREMDDPAFAFTNGAAARKATAELIDELKMKHSPLVIMATLMDNFATVMSAWNFANGGDLEKVRMTMESFKSIVLDACVENQNMFKDVLSKIKE